MNRHWLARGLVAALHLALLAALWQYRPALQDGPGERRLTTLRLITPSAPRPAPAPARRPELPTPRLPVPPLPSLPSLPSLPAPVTEPAVTTPAVTTPALAAPAAEPAPEATPPRSTLRLTLPPGYAASSAAARNPALSDPRSNTARPTLEDRIADATGGAGAWVEESMGENRSQSVGAQGDHRTVMRRGNTCVEIFRSRIADTDAFNGNVAPRALSMVGKPYKCK